MKTFEVYSLLPIEPVLAEGSWLWDAAGRKYLDMYGGHAVISVGHGHPRYKEAIRNQLDRIAFYSNSVLNPLQEELAEKLGRLSGYPEYTLFLCNSGAEANENALKLASFVTGRKKVIALRNAFHGRTSGAVAATDNKKIVASFNAGHDIAFVPMNDIDTFAAALDGDTAAVIIEGIQGVGGIHEPGTEFLQQVERLTAANGSILILDEIQSGYGRTGRFFAHQFHGIRPQLITTAKGMGNGFPVGGVLIGPTIQPWAGMLGTTFGGNHLACAAAIAVLDIIHDEHLMENAAHVGGMLIERLSTMSLGTIRGRGLMIGFDTPADRSTLRADLLNKHRIFTGEAKPNVVRLLPSLALTPQEADVFLQALSTELSPV